MIDTKVTCDHCGRDLTETKGAYEYRLVLANQFIPHTGSIVLDVLIPPPIDSTKHFCGTECLKKWVNK